MKTLLILQSMLLCACTTGSLKVTDPNTKFTIQVDINTLWSNVIIDKFVCTIHPDGSRSFSFDNLNNNTSSGQDSFNKMIPVLLGEVAKGAAQGVTGIK